MGARNEDWRFRLWRSSQVKRRCAFTLAVAQTPPGAPTATKQEKEETRIDFYLQQLREQRHHLPPQVKYHCADGYYAKQKYIDEVVALSLHAITKLRCDADCYFLNTRPRHAGQKGRPPKYDGKVNWQDLSRFEQIGTMKDAEHIHLYTAVVWH